MSNIYEQRDTAFKNTTAAVITDHKGNRLATIAFKYGNAVTCYLHIIGLEMAKGVANGGGYDRKSSSAWAAVRKIKALDGARPEEAKTLAAFTAALLKGDGGSSWDNALREAGYNVLFAI